MSEHKDIGGISKKTAPVDIFVSFAIAGIIAIIIGATIELSYGEDSGILGVIITFITVFIVTVFAIRYINKKNQSSD